MTETPTLTGQDIAEAQGALTTMLNSVLAGSGVSGTEWVAFRVITARGPWRTSDVLGEYLVSQPQLGLDQAAAKELVGGLVHKGLVTDDEPVTLTSMGSELFSSLSDTVRQSTRNLYEGLDQDDLATAHRVLAKLTERARLMV
jgi:DNA-binding MarR family transcriptional regulator